MISTKSQIWEISCKIYKFCRRIMFRRLDGLGYTPIYVEDLSISMNINKDKERYLFIKR